MVCRSCQQASPDEARFWLHCGAPLVAGSTSSRNDPERVALDGALGAQYEIGRLLGRGGMGAVYLARGRFCLIWLPMSWRVR